MPNRLAAESSPYLRQHADNPVDWYPWGPEALARARAEDRPILLSVGYSACHWCHVMAHESFEDPATAALMNELYVNVKVDREERPDLDHLYQAAVQLTRRSGGWPLTAFLMPDGRPFFTGTYFPDEARHGMPAFRDVLRGVHQAWTLRREEIESSAAGITDAIVQSQAPRGGELPPRALVAEAAQALTEHVDWTWGGLRGAPKFPTPPILWTQLRAGLAGDRRSLDAVLLTLRKMAEGGIHDQLGGGFHRYSTDAEWLAPHFEKMLYDNAQLVPLYLQAWRITGDPDLLEPARGTLDYLLREMTDPDGCFYAATDADSEGEEGRFFVWTPAQVHAVLADPELERAFARVYDLSPGGNWEGKTILRRRLPWAALARELGSDEAALREKMAFARGKLYEARLGRVPPLRDDKILVAWNGLAIVAFVEGWRATGELRWLDAARRAARGILGGLVRDGQLQHCRCGEDLKGPGLLDDHAAFGEALLHLHEADGDPRWLDAALALAGELSRFGDGDWWMTPHDGEDLFVRPRETHDGALPSGAAMAGSFLHRLWAHTDEARWRDLAERTLAAQAEAMRRNPYGSGHFLGLLDRWYGGFVEVVLAGEGPERRAMEQLAAGHPGLDHILLDLARLRPGHPAAQGRAATEPTAWVCRAGSCSLPVRSAEGLRALLEG